ncbi:hypothetical protein HPB51_027850 [Rhipicephalus microplus]|uniref:Uncharacterized protein n=1 Tax=Rhipicephalus microplus TaxID=6941 RepID=A0A9J6CYS8_RHIMP|nr:hypothetical protein HPB51_027850 [Rhipicephalus microplus]
MEHSTTVTPSSIEQGSSSVTENDAGHCVAVTTHEAHTLEVTSDPAFTSSLSGQQNDILTGKIMEDDAASNCPADHNDDDDAGGCWTTVIKKRCAHKMNAHTESQTRASRASLSAMYASSVGTGVCLDFL